MNILKSIPFLSGLSFSKIGIVLVVSLLLFCGGAWWGYTKGSAKSEAVISAYEKKLTDLQTKLDEKQVQIIDHVITKYVTKVVHIKDVGEHNENVAKTVVPDTGVLSNGWVYTHNAAAANQEADPARAVDDTSSGVKDTEALATVIDNYATYNKLKAQLEALQQYINETNASIDAENAKIAKKHHW